MKIGIIHPYFDVLGGAEITTLSLIEGLKKTSHQTTLYSVEPPKITETKNLKIHKIKKNNFSSFWRYQRLKKVQKLFKASLNEDVLIIMSGGLTLEDTRVKNVILYCHSTFLGEKSLLDEKSKGIKLIYLKMLKKNIEKSIKNLQSEEIKLISNSDFTKNEIYKNFKKDSFTIYPPVKISKWEQFYDKKKSNKVVTISRFSKEKNLDLAVDIMNKTKIPYDLIGNAKYEKQLSEYTKLKNKAKNNVNFYLNIATNELERLLASAKVYFHTSEETFGISVIEAMASGCIPIVPNNSAHIETVPYEELRFNNLDDAIEKIQNAINGKYDTLKPKLKSYINNFTEDNFRNKIIEFIEKLN